MAGQSYAFRARRGRKRLSLVRLYYLAQIFHFLMLSWVDNRMWVDIYEPQTEGELAVHVRKVDDVRRWLNEAFEGGPSGKLKKYRVSVL